MALVLLTVCLYLSCATASGFMKCWGLSSGLCIWLYQLRYILWPTFYILIKSTLICFHWSTFSITLKILQTQDHVDFPLCFISKIFASLWIVLTKMLGRLQSSCLWLFSYSIWFHYFHRGPDVSVSVGLPLSFWQNQWSVVLCFNLSSVLFYLSTHPFPYQYDWSLRWWIWLYVPAWCLSSVLRICCRVRNWCYFAEDLVCCTYSSVKKNGYCDLTSLKLIKELLCINL